MPFITIHDALYHYEITGNGPPLVLLHGFTGSLENWQSHAQAQDLHCCLNCRFYAPGRPNDCMSPTVEPVRDKERANFCGEFEFAEDRGQEKDGGSGQDARKTWDDLFGDT